MGWQIEPRQNETRVGKCINTFHVANALSARSIRSRETTIKIDRSSDGDLVADESAYCPRLNGGWQKGCDRARMKKKDTKAGNETSIVRRL